MNPDEFAHAMRLRCVLDRLCVNPEKKKKQGESKATLT